MLSLIKRKQTVNISQCIRSQDKEYYQNEKKNFIVTVGSVHQEDEV